MSLKRYNRCDRCGQLTANIRWHHRNCPICGHPLSEQRIKELQILTAMEREQRSAEWWTGKPVIDHPFYKPPPYRDEEK